MARDDKQDELDIAPKGGQQFRPPESKSSSDFVAALEKSAADAREALEGVDDAFLQTRWRLLARDQVVADMPRHQMPRETINHWSHHRGQMTVYLRLMGAQVPALYRPSADDKTFA